MKKVKIVFIIGSLGNGGAERTILNIINNIDEDKFDVNLCLLNGNGKNSYKEFLKKDINIIDLESRARDSVFKIAKVLRMQNPDIVFSTLSYINTVVYFAHKIALSKAKLILREANYMKVDYNMSKLSFFLSRYAYRNCDKVISLSKGVEVNLIENFNVSEKNIKRIYNPVDLKQIENMKTEKIAINDSNVFRLVNCGRLTKQKNHQLLIQAVSRINLSKDKWELIIIGDGEEKEDLIKLTKSLGLENNIRFIGFQKNPYRFMANANLFILTSSYEGFGHVVAESMACGTPVLSTDCPHGPSEILEDGNLGWLTPNEDINSLTNMINHLIENKIEIQNMKEKLQTGVNRFQSGRIVKEYEKVFLEILG